MSIRLKSATAVLVSPLPMAALYASTNPDVFKQRVLPVLEKHCATCHMVANPAGGLSVASFDALLSGGKHGPAIAPGDAKRSLLLQYLRGEKTPKMPMGGALSEDVIASLAKSIDEMQPAPKAAAKSDPHLDWLLHKPVPPPVPAVQDAALGKESDRRLRAGEAGVQGMQPAPPASKRAWLRRVYFDLIGLPPSPEDIEAFESDHSLDADEKVVGQASGGSRYGERWGRHWLDLARFAESDGFAIDGERPTAWRYRDYVIRAFNQDKRYDTFIKEQLAGDEMQGGGDRAEHLVALGFLRMGTWEADANFKTQLRQDVLNELTGTVGQVFLGFTVGCARCHDHKYDPIPQRDFYRLQAFFAPMRVEDRPDPFTAAEHPKLMKSMMRKYEDESEEPPML